MIINDTEIPKSADILHYRYNVILYEERKEKLIVL